MSKKDEKVTEEVTVDLNETSPEEVLVEGEVEVETKEAKKEDSLEEKVALLEEKLKESEDKYYRVHADFENVKKRLEKEKYQAIDYASEKFAKDLLTSIDTLEMALASSHADLSAEELLVKLKEGIDLTIKNFNTAFEKHDITL